ncbi:MAG: c-type cytochrome domain-containing protein [Bdellovibrionales bacterium]
MGKFRVPILLVSVSALLIFFQNCAKPKAADEMNKASSSSAGTTNTGGSTGGTGGTVPYNGPVVKWNDVYNAVFKSCTGCHGGANPSAQYSLTTYNNALSGFLILPGDPDGSYTYRRLAQGTMPPGAPISGTNLTLIRNWILQGAPNN